MKLVVNVPYLPTSFGSKDILVKNILDFYFYLNLIAERIFEFMMKIKSIFARDSTENGLKKQQQVTVAASHSSKPQQQLEPATTGAARVVEGVAATAVTALFSFKESCPTKYPIKKKTADQALIVLLQLQRQHWRLPPQQELWNQGLQIQKTFTFISVLFFVYIYYFYNDFSMKLSTYFKTILSFSLRLKALLSNRV